MPVYFTHTFVFCLTFSLSLFLIKTNTIYHEFPFTYKIVKIEANYQMKKSLLLSIIGLILIAFSMIPYAVAASDIYQEKITQVGRINFASLRLAIEDLTDSYPDQYPASYLEQLNDYKANRIAIIKALKQKENNSLQQADALLQFQRQALLANPLIDFDQLLMIKRDEKKLGLPMNWESNSSIPQQGYDNQIVVLSPLSLTGQLTTLYKPPKDRFVGDIDLHFDADRMLFSMPGDNGRWQVYELSADGRDIRQCSLIDQPDVDNYDACYLPDGNILFTSTAPFVGVPCVTGSSHVSNLFLRNSQTKNIRRLTFEQDHDWCPTVLNNGRILYLRWEYSDIPHFVSRILFHMNPDGTGQMEYYGSNSYWPNSMFYARPVPNHTTKFVAIVGGHHDEPRMGELVLFDPAMGRHEADGVIQRIPGRGGKVAPIIRDELIKKSWPKFLHPWPLSDKYFITSCKPSPGANWGIYLVDVFDNMTLIKELEDYALLEPIPFKKTTAPPVIPSKVQPESKDALVYFTDIYKGGGLKGVPQGTVKKLRLFTYHFAYHGMGGQVNRVGLDGPWDIKRVIGEVPVEEDGSAYFSVPANTPISLQPLDEEGKALQLMRSWMTAMPGEILTCVGCHEQQNTAPPVMSAMALQRQPSKIKPWYGPTRGFSFIREVQPVLDKYCIRCHDGTSQPEMDMPDFRSLPSVHPKGQNATYNNGTKFPPSYIALRSYVRAPTIESDLHLLPPGEFHADSTQLVQMLNKGHHNVNLSAEAWDRLITWIDLNTPAHGTWREIVGDQKVIHQRDRRLAMLKQYANIDENPEEILQPAQLKDNRTPPQPRGIPSIKQPANDWAFSPQQAMARQVSLGDYQDAIDLGNGIDMPMMLIPSGEFASASDQTKIRINDPYWISAYEITNQQYQLFNPSHDSRLEHGDFLQFSIRERGYPLNAARQPVVRVSWNDAITFCRWLSEKTGDNYTLPNEARWEYACRAGSESAMWYGDHTVDFSKYANLADSSFQKVDTFDWGLPSGAIPEWRPAIRQFNDKYRVSAPVGTYQPNPWGLYDMHGNAAEWTSTTATEMNDRKIVKGGSWYDRPNMADANHKVYYHTYLPVYNVGFRVIRESR